MARCPPMSSPTSARSATQDALIEYRRRNTDAVANHGGRFLVRGGEVEVLEGEWPHERCVVIEFPDAGRARVVGVGGVRAAQGHAPAASDTQIVLADGVVRGAGPPAGTAGGARLRDR